LRGDPSKIGDLTIAVQGKLWRNTVWLAEEVRNKKKGSSTAWTTDRWESLEAEFGPEIAQGYRDFCKSFWRLYKPQLRSEMGGDTNSVPWAVIIGLSGLAMEAGADLGWAIKLSAEEAALATRYALWEMNGLPPWFSRLYNAQNGPVSEVLL